MFGRVAIVCFFISVGVFGNPYSTSYFKSWSSLKLNYKLNKNVKFRGTIGLRNVDFDNNLKSLFQLKSSYKLKKKTFLLGGFRYTIGDNEWDGQTFRHRLFGGLKSKGKTKYFKTSFNSVFQLDRKREFERFSKWENNTVWRNSLLFEKKLNSKFRTGLEVELFSFSQDFIWSEYRVAPQLDWKLNKRQELQFSLIFGKQYKRKFDEQYTVASISYGLKI